MVSEEDPIVRLLRLAGPREAAGRKRSERVRAQVEGHWRLGVRGIRRRRALLRVSALAAAAALVVVIGRVVWPPSGTLPGTGAPVATLLRVAGLVRAGGVGPIAAGLRLSPGTEMETAAGGRAAVALSDGPFVRLDARTRVVLVSGSVVQLDRGAVYIDTVKGGPPRAAVEIRTKLGVVRDIGTQFEVRLEAGELRLSVRQGSAALDRAGQSFAASAGTRLVAREEGAVETGAVPPVGPDWSWVLEIAPSFDLEGRTLGDYLDWVSRETGWRVTFADPALASSAPAIVLHGSVAGLRPDETAPAVLPTCGLRHRLTDGTLVIERQTGPGGGS